MIYSFAYYEYTLISTKLLLKRESVKTPTPTVSKPLLNVITVVLVITPKNDTNVSVGCDNKTTVLFAVKVATLEVHENSPALVLPHVKVVAPKSLWYTVAEGADVELCVIKA